MSIFLEFEVKCKKCGSLDIETEDNRGYSEESGNFGVIEFVCVKCGNREALYE